MPSPYQVKIKRLVPEAKIPVYAHPGDAGLDLFSIESKTLMPGDSALVRTGISIALPCNTEAQIRPRSGLALKNQITLLNTPGTIDEGYRGEIGVIMINHGKTAFEIEKHMKIAQMVVKPVVPVILKEVSDLEGSERGSGGFGSTGLE